MAETIDTLWQNYTGWLAGHLPQYHKLLNRPATPEMLKEISAEMGIKLPKEYQAIYLHNNGDQTHVARFPSGSFLGFYFLSLDRMMREWRKWLAINEQGINKDGPYGTCFPPESIKPLYTNPRWIPMFSDEMGNYVGIDMDPARKGKVGQVINFGKDEADKFVIAGDLLEFMEFVFGEIREGNLDLAISREKDGQLSFGLRRKGHLIDNLRELFGPPPPRKSKAATR